MRSCKKCGSTTNGFHKNPITPDGLHTYCKVCRKALADVRMANETPEHRAERLRKQAEYRNNAERKVRQDEVAREWRNRNKERVRENGRNADRRRAAFKAEYNRQWRMENKERVAAHSRNRRAMVKNCEGSHTADDVFALLSSQRFCCAVCKTKLDKYHVDHVVPLVSGGSNDKTNLQVLCPTCNNQKHAADPIAFMQRKGFLL